MLGKLVSSHPDEQMNRDDEKIVIDSHVITTLEEA
jgi:hypothetical protein